MGLSYAYLTDESNWQLTGQGSSLSLSLAMKQNHNEEYYRYLITLVNREAADEWWRTISNFPKYAGTLNESPPTFTPITQAK